MKKIQDLERQIRAQQAVIQALHLDLARAYADESWPLIKLGEREIKRQIRGLVGPHRR